MTEKAKQVIRASDLRGICQLAGDGKITLPQAAEFIVGYIKAGQVKASMESIKELAPFFPKPNDLQYAKIETAWRSFKGLPAYELDRDTVERSIESQVCKKEFLVIPSVGAPPVPLCDLLETHKQRLEVRLIAPRAPRKPKEE